MTHDDLAGLAALDALGFAETWTDSARQHLRDCAECRSLLREMQEIGAMIGLTATAVDPPADLKKRILESASGSSDSVEEERVRRSPIWWLASAASFFLALWGWTELRLNAANEQLSTLETDRRVVAEEKQRLEGKRGELESRLGIISGVDSRIVQIAGATGAPGASGRLFIAPSQKLALVFFHGLPQNSSNDCYQLWLIRGGSSTPESAATFQVLSDKPVEVAVPAADGMQSVETIAVTREPAGGSTTPTAPMYLATKI